MQEKKNTANCTATEFTNKPKIRNTKKKWNNFIYHNGHSMRTTVIQKRTLGQHYRLGKQRHTTQRVHIYLENLRMYNNVGWFNRNQIQMNPGAIPFLYVDILV